MMSIKAIDSSSVHRITSGQVVIDLQTAIKELVENSLDAGASSVEVRFKDYGLNSIEVIDNGHGIAEEDYDSIALKHHTSKLASYEDLGTVLTFGFRGEALSSLCALSSSVIVTTASAAQAPIGTILEFDQTGRVEDRSGKVARKRGTTVTITGLFKPLPVRRKEFERNSKREFGKALNLLHAYALVPCTKENKGVRLTVSNHLEKGSRSVQIRTDGTPSLKASVSTLWGPKSLDHLVPLNLHLQVEAEHSSVLKNRGMQQDGTTLVAVKGLISKFSPGCGRTSTDRQFFYINGRPCNITKVQKAFNEIYRSYNANQAPFVIADFQLPTNACDINLSPDKRTIFIHSENNLIQALRAELDEAFSSSRSTFLINNPSSAKEVTVSRPPSQEREGADTPTNKQDGSQNQDHKGNEESTIVDSQLEEVEDMPMYHDKGDRKRLTGKETDLNPSEWVIASGSLRDSPPYNVNQTVICENEPEQETEDVNMASQNQQPDDPTLLAHEAFTPFVEDTSVSIDVDTDVPPLCNRVDHEHSSLRRPRTPLFAASPSPPPCSPTSWPGSRRTSIPPHPQARIESPSPSPQHSSPNDDPLERPRKRLRTISPPPVASVKSRPVQMVLGTKGASWNPQRDSSAVVSGQVRTIRTPATSVGSVRKHIRTRLDGFAMPGSQIKPVQADDDDDDTHKSDDASQLEEMAELEPDYNKQIGTRVQRARSDGEISPSAQKTVADKFLDVELPQGSPDSFLIPRSGPSVIDLTVTRADDDSDSVRLGQGGSSETSTEGAFRPEIVRRASLNVTLRLNLERLSLSWSHRRSAPVPKLVPSPPCSQNVLVTANVANIDDAKSAELELARVIHKEDFASMQILGQFNLGFIITRRVVNEAERTHYADDLFIIDQHAADEKYNFEILQQTTKIESQKLILPRSLELTAADELVAIENVNVLRDNGFEVAINEDACAGQGERVKLVAQPVSKGTTFDIKDLEELLHLMRDQPSGQMVRCSKARAMFAMRACRKSVMVGMPLTIGQMTSVVRHMGTMEQPWNCPHGRPTMRHLAGLKTWDQGRQATRRVEWANFSG